MEYRIALQHVKPLLSVNSKWLQFKVFTVVTVKSRLLHMCIARTLLVEKRQRQNKHDSLIDTLTLLMSF